MDGRRLFLSFGLMGILAVLAWSGGLIQSRIVYASEYERVMEREGKFTRNFDMDFAKRSAGKIYLQTEEKGEAWYISPRNYHRYYLGTPEQARQYLKHLSLPGEDSGQEMETADLYRFLQDHGEGIANEHLRKIPLGNLGE